MILVVFKTTLIARDGMSVHLLEPLCGLLTSFPHLSESISSKSDGYSWDIHSEKRTSHSSNILDGSSELWTLSGLSSHNHYLLTAVLMKRGGSSVHLLILPSARNPSIHSNQVLDACLTSSHTAFRNLKIFLSELRMIKAVWLLHE